MMIIALKIVTKLKQRFHKVHKKELHKQQNLGWEIKSFFSEISSSGFSYLHGVIYRYKHYNLNWQRSLLTFSNDSYLFNMLYWNVSICWTAMFQHSHSW